jgi:hypothetical protein
MSSLHVPLASAFAANTFYLLLALIPSLRPAERYRRRHEVLAGPRRGARLPD